MAYSFPRTWKPISQSRLRTASSPRVISPSPGAAVLWRHVSRAVLAQSCIAVSVASHTTCPSSFLLAAPNRRACEADAQKRLESARKRRCRALSVSRLVYHLSTCLSSCYSRLLGELSVARVKNAPLMRSAYCSAFSCRDTRSSNESGLTARRITLWYVRNGMEEWLSSAARLGSAHKSARCTDLLALPCSFHSSREKDVHCMQAKWHDAGADLNCESSLT